MSEFTKGPWKVEDNHDDFLHITTKVSFASVAMIPKLSDKLLGNANLIAAAPELYEALDDLLDELLNCGGHNVTEAYVIKAKAALAKASGKGE